MKLAVMTWQRWRPQEVLNEEAPPRPADNAIFHAGLRPLRAHVNGAARLVSGRRLSH